MLQPMIDETRAVAHLPSLDIEIVHRRDPDAGAEMLTLQLRATPSFDSFAKAIESNPFMAPFLAWANFIEAAWSPWRLMPGMKALADAAKPPHLK